MLRAVLALSFGTAGSSRSGRAARARTRTEVRMVDLKRQKTAPMAHAARLCGRAGGLLGGFRESLSAGPRGRAKVLDGRRTDGTQRVYASGLTDLPVARGVNRSGNRENEIFTIPDGPLRRPQNGGRLNWCRVRPRGRSSGSSVSRSSRRPSRAHPPWTSRPSCSQARTLRCVDGGSSRSDVWRRSSTRTTIHWRSF